MSSLKQGSTEPYLPGETEGLGLENATLRWNEVLDQASEGKDKNVSPSRSPSESTDDASTAIGDNASERSIGDSEDRRFELRDISVKFPEAELTLVTGPTASGKTALLVRRPNRLSQLNSTNFTADGGFGRNDTCIGEDNHEEGTFSRG